MLKKLHTQNTQFSKIQVLIVLIICIFAFDTCLIIFPKFYNKFRTNILSPTHCYITHKPIQNILKNVWNSKYIQKIISGQNGRLDGRSVPISGQNGQPPCQRTFSVGAFVHVVSRLTGRPPTLAVDRSVNQLRDPNSWLGPMFWFSLLNGRAVDRPVDWSQCLLYGWAVGRPTELPIACQMAITAGF